MRLEVDGVAGRFLWRQGRDWTPIGDLLDASMISDEGGRGEHGSFTGAFLGLPCMDITGQGREARLARFDDLPNGIG
jgi:xylan 1,4-beta-xylosidase